jgi:spore maturation protein CgeB
VFVGSYYPNRLQLFESLDLNRYDFGIWGSGWNVIPDDSPCKGNIRKIHTGPEEWIKIYSNSKIILVAHYPGTEEIPVYQASPKIYEAMACGGFVMCDNQKDVKTLFNNEEHLVIFKDPEDLNDKINYYLTHEAERHKIAISGYREVLDRHTYVHRLEHMLSTLKSSGIF